MSSSLRPAAVSMLDDGLEGGAAVYVCVVMRCLLSGLLLPPPPTPSPPWRCCIRPGRLLPKSLVPELSGWEGGKASFVWSHRARGGFGLDLRFLGNSLFSGLVSRDGGLWQRPGGQLSPCHVGSLHTFPTCREMCRRPLDRSPSLSDSSYPISVFCFLFFHSLPLAIDFKLLSPNSTPAPSHSLPLLSPPPPRSISIDLSLTLLSPPGGLGRWPSSAEARERKKERERDRAPDG